MTASDAVTFKRCMFALSTAFDKKVSDPKTDLYWRGLEDVPIEKLEAAVGQWIKTGGRFPRIAELRALCDPPVAAPSTRRLMPAGAREFGHDRGYEVPDDVLERHGGYQQVGACHCSMCRRAQCFEPPIFVPELVTMPTGQQVELGRWLHGEELTAHLRARADFEIALERWASSRNKVEQCESDESNESSPPE